MKVYLAAQYSRKIELSRYAVELLKAKIEVTATWLQEPEPPETTLEQVTDERLRAYAQADIADVSQSDCLVFFSEDPKVGIPRGGRHVEFGYCLARDIQILVVGPRENIFHFLPQIARVDTWNQAKKILIKASKQPRLSRPILNMPILKTSSGKRK